MILIQQEHNTSRYSQHRSYSRTSGPGRSSSVPGPDREAQNQHHRTRFGTEQSRSRKDPGRGEKDQANSQGLGGSQIGTLHEIPAPLPRRGSILARAMEQRQETSTGSRPTEDIHDKSRGERMTKNREGPLPRADKATNDKRPGLPDPTILKPVTWVQPGPTTSDVTFPKQLSPATTWSEPSATKSILAKGSPGLSTTRDKTKEQAKVYGSI